MMMMMMIAHYCRSCGQQIPENNIHACSGFHTPLAVPIPPKPLTSLTWEYADEEARKLLKEQAEKLLRVEEKLDRILEYLGNSQAQTTEAAS